MQVLPATAKRFGVKDPRLPRENIFAGASYLKLLMNIFDSDVELVLAAYNAGERAVLNAGRKVPEYPETKAYVRDVMSHLNATHALPL
jgi:soluble lytic murein transglycosylase-like protein